MPKTNKNVFDELTKLQIQSVKYLLNTLTDEQKQLVANLLTEDKT